VTGEPAVWRAQVFNDASDSSAEFHFLVGTPPGAGLALREYGIRENKHFGFQFQGLPGRRYAVQTSPDLIEWADTRRC
jgi:hypothetical protein